MIIGCLGKGGSGKSTVATQLALFLSHQGTVLAIDADHNLDLTYNLAGEVPVPYYGSSLGSLLEACGAPSHKQYDEVFFSEPLNKFSLTPLSEYIAEHSCALENGIRLMSAGPQTDIVLHGQSCSHSLTTPLKVLLPLLSLQPKQYVVVDEKAGADGVSTGIVTGLDVGVIVVEPALHSLKTGRQIAELMEFYRTPYVFVANKCASKEDELFIRQTLGVEPLVSFSISDTIRRSPGEVAKEWNEAMGRLVSAFPVEQSTRLTRTTEKFSRNRAFAAAT